MHTADAFIDHLVATGWTFEAPREPAVSSALAAVTDAAIPAGHIGFLRRFGALASGDDSRWFLSAFDYAGLSGSAFAWDEFRAIGLDAADTVADRVRVEAFWAECLPILVGVRGDYEFLAISRTNGAVLHGTEPDFEDTTMIAPGLHELMDGVLRGNLLVPLLRA
ncbi:hypothetical protein G419_11097 [Rhodococcus triatomae BKS 15-14]|nr:hypothetical protein G419_11097 [Rhodococcus triatomae BKS 15-14]